MLTQEQRDAWTIICNEGAGVGLHFIHIPTGCLLPSVLQPNGVQNVYLVYDDPDAAIKGAKRSIAFKKAYPDITHDPVEIAARWSAFDAQNPE